MCGILGAVGPVDRAKFETSLDTLIHRGPDGKGIWQDSNFPVTLGHRRLSIIDVSSGGHQPMTGGRCVLTFNGEIYNFLEIRETLKNAGRIFHTESDSEVLLAAYQHWGPKCVHQFNGMWALAIWDTANRTLFLSRDRFGKKPLFYTFQKERFCFASEMKALMPLMDNVAPSNRFSELAGNVFHYEQGNECLIEGIQRFPAGSSALLTVADIDAKRMSPTKYWDTRDHLQDVPRTYDEQVERFRELFLDACRLRMRSDVPIGTALSGGIDSSAICCTMHHLAGDSTEDRMAENWQRAFVATFPDSELDETEYAQCVVDHVGLDGVFLPIDPVAAIDDLYEYLYLFEEIYATSPMPMIRTYRAVRDHGVKVTIDGHGADELLSGYDGFLNALDDAWPNIAYAKHILKAFGHDHPSLASVLKKYREIHSGNRGFASFLGKWVTGGLREDASRGQYGAFNSTLYDCFHHSMLPTLLRNYDRYSMAASVEIRMPFMDHRLVSYYFSLPWQSKVPRTSEYTKAPLRDAVGAWMPNKVRYRKSKVGFNTPMRQWMKGPWKDFILDTVDSSEFKNCGLIDSAAVRGDVEMVVHQRVSTDQADRAWASLMPFYWEKAFLGNSEHRVVY